MHQAVEDLASSPAVPDGHLQGVDGQVRAQAGRDLPADDHAGVHVDDEGRVYPPGVRLDVGQVRHPQPVRRRGLEVPVDQICRAALTVVVAGGDLVEPPPSGPREAHLAHQALHRATGHPDAFSVELGPDLVRPVDLKVVGVDTADLLLQVPLPQLAG